MGTLKPKLQGYVEQELFDRFTQWKSERGIGNSAALNELLSEFFGMPSLQVSAPPPDEAHIKQIVELLIEEKVGKRLEDLEEKISNLLSNPPRLPLKNTKPRLPSESPPPSAAELRSGLSSEEPPSLSGTELAKRLRIDKSLVTKNRGKTSFEEWTASKDPESIAWRYMADTKRYEPAPTDN